MIFFGNSQNIWVIIMSSSTNDISVSLNYEWQSYTLKYLRIIYSVMSDFTLTECLKIGALFIYKSNRVVWNRLHHPVNGIKEYPAANDDR